MPVLTIEQMIIALIDLNYSAKEISVMHINDMYRIVYANITNA